MIDHGIGNCVKCYAVCLTVWLSNIANLVCAQDALEIHPATMPPALADALSRLPRSVRKLAVSQGPYAAWMQPTSVLKVIEPEQSAQTLCDVLYQETMFRLWSICPERKEFLKTERITWCVDACVESLPRKHALDRTQRHGLSVYIFDSRDSDPASRVVNVLGDLPGTKRRQVSRTTIIERSLPETTGQMIETYSCWSPRRGLLVLVEGDGILSSAVEMWEKGEVEALAIPWDRPEWGFWDAQSRFLAILTAPPLQPNEPGVSGVVIRITPSVSNNGIRGVWVGRGGAAAIEETSDRVLLFPSPLPEVENPPYRLRKVGFQEGNPAYLSCELQISLDQNGTLLSAYMGIDAIMQRRIALKH